MAVDKGNVEAVYPLSPMQSGMLFHSLREPQAGYHIEQNRYTLTGKLNVESFEHAWRKVIGRHSILRTAFSSAGKMSQVVFKNVALPIAKHDLRHLSPAEQKDRLRTVLEADRRRVSETTKAPLMRLALLRMADDSYLFIWSCHHLLMDGWSSAVVLNELASYYNANEQGRELNLSPPRPFHDYIHWLQKQDRGQAEEFWKTSLQGFSAPTPLPIQGTRSNAMNSDKRAQKAIKLPASAGNSLSLWARQHHLTLNTIMQGVWALLLSRYSGEADVVFGITVAGRPADLPGSENLVGIFINTLPLRVQFNPQDRVLDWLSKLQQRQVEVTQYQYAALVDIQGWSDVPRGVQLFDSLLIFENYPIKAFDGMGANGSSLQVQVHASELKLNYPLAITAVANPEMTLEIGYDSELFTSASIDRLLANIQGLLAAIVNAQDQKVSELALVSEAEGNRLLLEWNQTSVDYGRHCTDELFERQAMSNAHATALICEGQWMSYEDLNRRANQLAHYLAEVGVGPEIRVAIYMQRSIEMIVALIGVLKAGGVCAPLDPGYPAERISFMLDDSQARVLLTSQSLVNSLPAHSARVLCLDTQWDLIAGQDATNPNIGIDPENAAYIIYTSGSTGKAKGVLLPHRAICNVMHWMTSEFPLTNSDRVVQKASISFDASMLEIFFPLAAGAAILIAAPEGHRDIDYLIRLIADHKATYIDLVPSLLKAMLDTGQFHQRGSLRYISSGGEALSLETVNLYFDKFNLPLCNMYGPSETTIHSTTWNCRKDSKMREVPIGVPLTNTQVYVLDEQKQLVPIGGAGELYIAGKGVARGYLNQPGLTAEKFLPNPFSAEPGDRMYRTGDWVRWSDNGCLIYLGRRDHQVKIRGFRIELGEIEAALEQHPVVEQAVVMKREDKSGNSSLVAYFVPGKEVGYAGTPAQDGSDNLALALRRHLTNSLPGYMVPSAFVEMERLPLTPNGKLDRKALPVPDQVIDSGSAYHAPRSQVEEILCGIWEQILGSGRVGIEENFFEAGGHSLLAAQVISRIRDVLRVELPLRILFESPTVAGLAQELEQAAWQRLGAEPEILPVSRDRLLPLSYAQQRLWFVDQLEPGSSAYNVPTAVRLRGELHVAALRRSINEIIRRHEVLRTSFPQRGGQPFQHISPASEVNMAVIDLSEEPRPQAEATALRLARHETHQAFDLSRGPMLRAMLLRIGEADHVLVITMHHIASDGWSVAILIREFMQLYSAYRAGEESPLQELKSQYADFAVWQRQYLSGETLEEQLKYWKRQLEGINALEMPADKPRPAILSNQAASVRFILAEDLSDGLKALGKQEGATLFIVLLAGFQLLLSHFSSRTDVVVGTSVSNRNRSEIENLIGFFVNQLVLRTRLEGVRNFKKLVHKVREVVLQALTHQDLPFELLVDEAAPTRRLGNSPLFDAKLVLQNAIEEKIELPGLQFEEIGVHEPGLRNPLYLELSDTHNGLQGLLQYSPELYEAATINLLVEQLKQIYASAVETPEIDIKALCDKLNEIKRKVQEKHQQQVRQDRSRLWKSAHKTDEQKNDSGPHGRSGIRIASDKMVNYECLSSNQLLPLIISPAIANLNPCEWALYNKQTLEAKLRRHGAILFRGFQIETASDFHDFVKTFSSELMMYDEPTTPRSLVGENVYTSTDYPADQIIPPHNERSYSITVPQKLYFWCDTPAPVGGLTPLCDSRKVWQRIDQSVREEFIRKGWMFGRNFSDEVGLRWQNIFQSSDPKVVEEYCRRASIEWEWKPGGRLTTRQVRAPIAKHPVTGETVWFNHVVFFHISTLESRLREILLSNYGEENLPNNTYYGDGSPIAESVIRHLRDAYDQETVSFAWQKGDLIILDNFLTSHGRTSYSGHRKILFAMAEPYTREDCKSLNTGS
jgi:amino acid adenylation domain-containing protein